MPGAADPPPLSPKPLRRVTRQPKGKSMGITQEQTEAFLAELAALTIKHGIQIGGCGCCGSPFLDPTDAKDGAYEHHNGSELFWSPAETNPAPAGAGA